MPKQDAISILEQDHARVRTLFAELKKNSDDDQREALLEELAIEIQSHTTLEEDIFYPAFRDAVSGRKEEQLYFEALEEHGLVDYVLPQVEQEERGSPTFLAKCKVLEDLVMHHLQEEENRLFPLVRKVMSADQMSELAEELEERKAELEEDEEEVEEDEDGDEEVTASADEQATAGGESTREGGQRGRARQSGQGGRQRERAAQQTGKIDINTATVDELEQISGIDETRAEKLIRHREAHGKFESWDDVRQVEGFDVGMLRKLQEGATLGR